MKMNEMLYALTDFCIEQDDTETADEDTIAAMIGGLRPNRKEPISTKN